MASQIEKLRAYTGHLLDEVIHLREKYALLEPMIFKKEVTGEWSRGHRARGFQTLRTSLLYSCAQDVAKIASDSDRRVPSFVNLIGPLANDHLRARLREDFAIITYQPNEEDRRDPVVLRALDRIGQRETAERREQFDDMYVRLQEEWEALRTSAALQSFVTIRDKVTAHTELKFGQEEYRRVDVGSLGLKWEDLQKVIDQIQSVTDKLNLLIRASSFVWPMLDEQLAEAAESFWDRTPTAPAEGRR